MKKVLLLAVAAAVSALAGCASTGEGSDHPFVEKQYRTGSNLAVKRSSEADGVSTVSKDDLERARDSSLNAGRGMPPPPSGSR